jgi:YaiO family outer membrane protein
MFVLPFAVWNHCSLFGLWKAARVLIVGLGLFFFLATGTAAQSLSADDYFLQARKMAFDQKNYPAAIRLCRQALQQSPDYLDISIFLGRVYYWNNQSDSSLLVLQGALQTKPDYEDATQALADISYFLQDYSKALAYSNQGLQHHPASRDLALRKARSLAALSRNREALALSDSLLQIDPANEQLRSLASQLKEANYQHKIGVSYDYTYFDRQFTEAWHLGSISYSRQTNLGSFIGRLNYTNRFARNGLQLEADAYPRISKTFYAYTSAGYSPDMPLFPKFRAGFSLYANLPKAFEAEGGFRYLYFDDNTWIYTVSAGKYYKNFWFNIRTYVTPGEENISQSYSFTTRYYLKGADDYFSFTLGRGLSPDDRLQAVRLNSTYRLQTVRAGAGYRFSLARRHLFSFHATFENAEFSPETKGNQLDLSVGYQLRF